MAFIGDWIGSQLSGLFKTIGSWFGASGSTMMQGLSDKYFNTTFNSDRQRAEDMAYNSAESEKQRAWEEQMWQQTNQWNSPAAQMQRFRAAGLNPSLMMSGGGLSGAAATVPSGSEASYNGAVGLANGNIADLLNLPSKIKLINSQARLNDAQARKEDAQTTYQEYLNQVEEELKKIPIGTVRTVGDDGQEDYQVIYGNYRVEMSKRQLHALGLSTQGLQYQLNDLYYNLAVLTGSDTYPNSDGTEPASSTPNFEKHVKALQGDYKVRELSGKLAQIGYEAAQAEKAGREAYAEWLKEHKDDPVVKFALTIQGFLQTFGISLPSISHSQGTTVNSHGSRSYNSWYFGN